ncbi:ribonuclease Z [Candidatus Thorarchaeota archaeon]|nr:MAG: ribonuclease Z [Candidatus Thorarchaeota archaeon]
MIEIVLLGTGGSMPTENRNLPAIAIRYQGWVLLLDSGEDIQRQIERASLGLNKKMAIFISHNHADHLLGLPGLLLRFSLLGRIKPLKIFGPKELIEYVKVSQATINLGTTFETVVYAIEPGVVFQEDNLTITAFEVNHRGFALGFKISIERPTGVFIPERAEELGIQKGPLWGKLASGESVILESGLEVHPEDVTGPRSRPLTIVYSGDTRPCEALRDASVDADILISEAMYTIEHADLAEERGHSTASAAAQIALDSNVGLLVLTHYSPRYFDGSEILREGKEIFPNTILARDLMRIALDKDGTITVTDPGIIPPAKDQV